MTRPPSWIVTRRPPGTLVDRVRLPAAWPRIESQGVLAFYADDPDFGDTPPLIVAAFAAGEWAVLSPDPEWVDDEPDNPDPGRRLRCVPGKDDTT